MTALRLAALAALLGGLALLGYAAVSGQVDVGFFLIVPYVVGRGPAAFLGMLLLMAAPVLWLFGAAQRVAWEEAPPARPEAQAREAPPPQAPQHAEAPRRVRSGGVVLLGPIPIVWGSDRRILPWMVGAGALLLLLAFLLTWRP